MQFLISYDLDNSLLRSIPSKRRSLSFSKFGCSIESNSQNRTEKMKMVRSELPPPPLSHESLPHKRKIFQTDRSSQRRCSVKKGVLKIFRSSHLRCSVKRFRKFHRKIHTYVGVSFLRTSVLKNICQRLLLNSFITRTCFWVWMLWRIT